MRSQQGELDSLFGQQFQALHIDSRLRQPHALGIAPEPVLKIAHSPHHLRVFVARVGKRQDGVVVRLRQRRSVAGKILLALPIRRQDSLVRVGRMAFQPGQQCGAKIEADARVVIDDLRDPRLSIHDPRSAVGQVALCRDPFVPIVIGRSRVLKLDRLKPRILSGRLIKVTMDAYVALHRTGFPATGRRGRKEIRSVLPCGTAKSRKKKGDRVEFLPPCPQTSPH
jgi:hypothetical protein